MSTTPTYLPRRGSQNTLLYPLVFCKTFLLNSNTQIKEFQAELKQLLENVWKL